jgi:hypothetical protein
LVQARDRVFMEEIIKLLPRDEWEVCHRVRKFKKFYLVSQAKTCDGVTVDPPFSPETPARLHK